MIRYIFKFDSGLSKTFEIDLDKPTLIPDPVPEWMLLDSCKCSNCPLNSSEVKVCPAAVEVAAVVEVFADTRSTEKVLIRVETPDCNFEKNFDTQGSITPLLGLLMGKSDCPILKELRGLFKLHFPFAGVEETIFRGISAHFLKQYFRYQDDKNKVFDLSELAQFYKNLCTVNNDFMQRLRLLSKKDANLNAMVYLHTVNSAVEMSLEAQLFMLVDQFTNK